MSPKYSLTCGFCEITITDSSEKDLKQLLKKHQTNCKAYKSYLAAEGYMTATGE